MRSFMDSSRRQLRKYFKEGQLLSEDSQRERPPPPEDSLWVYKKFIYERPRLAGVAIPAIIVHILWWSAVIPFNLLPLYKDNYYAALIMIGGSALAGGTSEGGAAIAYPILTLCFNIPSVIARDFGMMIQTFGMNSASFTILYQQVQVEWRAIWFATLGGIPGVTIGLGVIAPNLPGSVTKVTFVSVWLAFAASLFLLNLNEGRHVFLQVPRPKPWKNAVLVLAGFIGGILTSLSGSGIDICSFAALTLLFRVSEKVATPTSVILMSINTTIGFWFKATWLGGMHLQAWKFLACAIPVAVIMAPVGAFLGSYCHRLVLAAAIYVVDTVQYIGALYVVLRNVPNPLTYGLSSGAAVIVGWAFFWWLTERGKMMLATILAEDTAGTIQQQKIINVGSTLDLSATAPGSGNSGSSHNSDAMEPASNPNKA